MYSLLIILTIDHCALRAHKFLFVYPAVPPSVLRGTPACVRGYLRPRPAVPLSGTYSRFSASTGLAEAARRTCHHSVPSDSAPTTARAARNIQACSGIFTTKAAV